MSPAITTFGLGTAAPTTGFHNVGQIVLNTAPDRGKVLGWICTAEGTPGTWVPIAAINQHGTVDTYTAAATIADGAAAVLLNAAAGFTLPKAENAAVGSALRIKNINAGAATLSPATGNDYVDAAAITLTQNQYVVLMNNGTHWYKIG